MLDGYFEDLQPGDLFRSRGRTVTEADLVIFSMITHDWADIHTDSEFVKKTHFKRRIAHAGATLAVALGLARISSPHVVRIGNMHRLRFLAPVFLEDTIQVELRVTGKHDWDQEYGRARMEMRITNQEGLRVVESECDMLVVKKGGGALREGTGDAVL